MEGVEDVNEPHPITKSFPFARGGNQTAEFLRNSQIPTQTHAHTIDALKNILKDNTRK